MVKLICTPFHSGKSEYVYSQIVKKLSEGKKVILMVPEQEAVIAEAALCRLLDGKNSLNLEVLNFKRLCNRVFREYGGLCYNYVNKGGQAVILWRVLSLFKPELRQIKISESLDESLISELLSLFKTFGQCGITADMLDKACSCANGALKDKLTDIALIYTEYRNILSENYDDANDDLDRLYDILCTHGFFAGKCVYFDSFYDFTSKELDIIEKIMESADICEFTVEYFDGEDCVNYLRPLSMKQTLCSRYHKLTGQMPEITTAPFSYNVNNAVKYAYTNLWNYCAKPYLNDNNSVKIYSENDKYAQSRRCANICAELVRQGCRYKEIAVISRNMSEYEGIIDTYLEAKNIPCHISKRNRLFVHPAVRVLLGALSVISHGWKCEEIISYMKTGYTGLSAEEAALISSYIRLWNIRGKRRYDSVWNMNTKDHTDALPEDIDVQLKIINDIREKLVEPLLTLSDELLSSKSATDTAGLIYKFLIKIGLDEKLNNSKDYIVWNTLTEVLEQYADCAPDKINTENLLRMLRMIINSTDIGNIPVRCDEVTLGNADMIRLNNIKHIIILGANDGEFPKVIKDNSFFYENELETLKEFGIEMPDNIDKRINDEKFFFARAISFASESVTVIYSGRPSEAVTRITELFPNAVNTKTDILKEIHTLNDALLQSVLTEDPMLKKALDNIVGKLNLQIEVCDNEKISEDNISLLYKGDIKLTKSRIDALASCPFKYRLIYDIAPSKMTSPEILSNETGTFLHSLFERSLKRVFSEGEMTASEEEFKRIIEEEAFNYISKGFGSQENIAPTVNALFCDLTQTARRIASSMYREFSKSRYIPTLFECSIGTREGDYVYPYSVQYDENRKAFIYGICDRLDILKSGDNAYCRVVDYKSGKNSFNAKEIKEGKSMQLPMYLFSFCRTENSELKKKLGIKGEMLPGGFIYYRMSDPNIKIGSECLKEVLQSDGDSYIDNFIQRSGVSLNDQEVSDDLKNSIPNTKMIEEISGEGVDEIESDVKEGIHKICDILLAGEASKSDNPNESYCRSCEYRTICRRGDVYEP
ncbi:MAG: PD-(D/E)XK nuclease family protein [Clostridia bacterium]|nr:PD-(D/E)XK nuclease family protein [Clostridia bacterium]